MYKREHSARASRLLVFRVALNAERYSLLVFLFSWVHVDYVAIAAVTSLDIRLDNVNAYVLLRLIHAFRGLEIMDHHFMS